MCKYCNKQLAKKFINKEKTIAALLIVKEMEIISEIQYYTANNNIENLLCKMPIKYCPICGTKLKNKGR